jgi:hypothetical protein
MPYERHDFNNKGRAIMSYPSFPNATIAALAASAQQAAEASTDPGADSEIVRVADEIIEVNAASDRLSDECDEMEGRKQQDDFRRERIDPLVRRGLEMRAELARMPATTLAGFRAKARIVREFSNCANGYATGYEDDAVAWSLANDLLGITSVLKEKEEHAPRQASELPLDERLDREDPWAARWGSPPFREQFPLWERQPASMGAFISQAESDFPWLGMCEILQRRSMAELEHGWREIPEYQAALLRQLEPICDRYQKARLAMHGELIRLMVAKARVFSPADPDDEL